MYFQIRIFIILFIGNYLAQRVMLRKDIKIMKRLSYLNIVNSYETNNSIIFVRQFFG